MAILPNDDLKLRIAADTASASRYAELRAFVDETFERFGADDAHRSFRLVSLSARSVRALGVELKSSGSPLRQAVGLVLRHHPDVILDLIRQDLGTVGALTPERVAEIIADLAACTGPAQRG